MLRFSILLLILASSCSSHESSNDSAKIQEEKPIEKPPIESIGKEKIPLDLFPVSEFPAEIDGCACYYWLPGANDKFIYVDDYARSAFIKVNGTFEALEVYDVYSDGDIIQQKCRAEHWNLTVDLKAIGQIDETTQYAGTLKIVGIDGTIHTAEINGECGC